MLLQIDDILEQSDYAGGHHQDLVVDRLGKDDDDADDGNGTVAADGGKQRIKQGILSKRK